jgi:rubrerythrin
MKELFEVFELVKIAIEDEKSGVIFYSALSQKSRSASLRKLFSQLAEQERYHQKRFEAMLQDLGDATPREQYDGEYMDYLRALTSARAFPDVKAAQNAAAECASDAAALDIATQFERDTLILMNEMGGMVPEKDMAIVKELAREEQAHLVALAGARAALAG